ncbi:MAG: H+transporting two-sector ATPase subunit [Caulobacter sp.]|nr:H+transporting two-sector ATPase subunit [Caulobacter sp.]
MATEHHGTVETTAAPEAHGGGGLPQLQFEHWGGQIVWLLLIFAVLYAVLAKGLLPRVSGAIETRGAKIADDIAGARRLKDEAEVQARAAAAEVAEARAKAQKTAVDAKAAASAEAATRQAKEEVVLAEKLAAAEARIQATRDEAMGHVRDVAKDTAAAIVQKLTGKAATAAELKSALA